MLNQWVKPLLVLSLACVSALPLHAQVGTPKWNFRNRAEVEAASRKYKLNLRESYNIIMCAKRQGMIRSAVRAYEQELPASPFDTPPELASSFALAHELMTSSVRWDWPWDTARGLTKLTQGDGVRITLYRDRALQALPKSPEVLLNHAIWAMMQDEREKALNLTTKALRYAPNWAELNWWHATTLEYRVIAMGGKRRDKEEPRYGALMLPYLAKAARLDPSFKQEGLSRKADAYSYLGRYKQALDAYDAYVRYKPSYVKYIGERSHQATRRLYIEEARKRGQL